jgi:hypothetical protein
MPITVCVLEKFRGFTAVEGLERLILGVCWGGLLGDEGRTIRDVEGLVLGTIMDVL